MASAVSMKVVQSVVTHLQSSSGDPDSLCDALRTLSDTLQVEESLRSVLREQDVLPLLLHLAQEEAQSETTREAAIACLVAGTFENVENKFLLGEMNAIPFLLDCLRRETPSVDLCILLLGNLCSSIRCNQDFVFECGGIPTLLPLLRKAMDEGKPQLLPLFRTIQNIVNGHELNTALFVSEEGMDVLETFLGKGNLEQGQVASCVALISTLMIVNPTCGTKLLENVQLFEGLEDGEAIMMCLSSFGSKTVYGSFERSFATSNGFVFNDSNGPGVEIHCPINGPKLVFSEEIWSGSGTLRWVLRREQGNSSFLVGAVPDATCRDNHALRVPGALAVKNSSTSYSELPAVISVDVGSRIEVCIDGSEKKVKFLQNGVQMHSYSLEGHTNLRLCLVCWNNGRMRLLPEDFSE